MSHWVRLTFSRLFNLLVPRGKALWTRLSTLGSAFIFRSQKFASSTDVRIIIYGGWSSRQRLFGRHCQGSSGRSTLAVSRRQVWRAEIGVGEFQTSYPSLLPRACSLCTSLISSAIARNPALISWGFLGGKAERAVTQSLYDMSTLWPCMEWVVLDVIQSAQKYDFDCLRSLRKEINHVSDRDCSKNVLKLRLRTVSLF